MSVLMRLGVALSGCWTVRRWRFCEENNVQLRDEYDQINRDLAPHWAL